MNLATFLIRESNDLIWCQATETNKVIILNFRELTVSTKIIYENIWGRNTSQKINAPH